MGMMGLGAELRQSYPVDGVRLPISSLIQSDILNTGRMLAAETKLRATSVSLSQVLITVSFVFCRSSTCSSQVDWRRIVPTVLHFSTEDLF